MDMRALRGIIKKYFFEAIGFFLVGSLLLFFALSSRGEQSTQQFFDGIRTTAQRKEVVIVGIDDKSLQALGAWPWDRHIFAEVTKKLDGYGVKSIVYDVLFLEPRLGDNEFKDALLHTQSTVILASKVGKNNYLASFLDTGSSTHILSGFSNVEPSIDGKVRNYSVPKQQNNTCLYSLSEQAFRFVTFKKYSTCEVQKSLGFRYPQMVTIYSFVDILSNKIDSKSLQEKVIFIGSTALDLEDHFIGMSGEKIPGVQVHASMLTSLLNKEGDRVLSGIEIALLIIVCMSSVLFILHHLKTILAQTIAIGGSIILVFLVSYIFFSNHIIIPLPWLLLSILLSGGYSTLIRFIKEKKRSENISLLFSKYVHKDVLRELMKSPEALTLTGEKRYLTVLFSDLRGFTTLSEALSPEKLTMILNGYFSAMTPVILEERGTIDKYIGDAIMAFWNAPLEVLHHEQRAVSSAIRMQEALIQFNKENGASLAVGIGIHAGDAVVGNVGSKERVNYTILGDTVNLASRVESLTKKYGVGILVTEEVRKKVDYVGILFRKLDVITVKGKSQLTTLYEAMRMSNDFKDIVKDYEIAFSHYQVGQFEKAKILFKALGKRGDIPSSKMYERILTLKSDENWDGVWHFDEK